METHLTRQHIYIDYFDPIFVYNEKSRQAEDFNKQHVSWMLTQWKAVVRNIRFLPMALLNRHYDLIDRLLQWILLPRMIMMAIIVAMGLLIPFIYLTAALKWWLLFAVVLFIFALATPNYLVDDKWDKTFFKIPFVLFSNVLNKFKIGRAIQNKINLKD